jgi:HSP20 family protein
MNSWDPFRDFLSVQERVNRLFENALGAGGEDTTSGGTWSPAVDICETESEYVVKAELPEVKRSDIDIRIRGNTLTIEGERKLRRTVMEGYHRLERIYGRFRRSFLLPGALDQDSITASLKDGILKIVLPKKGNTADTEEVTVRG